MSLQNRFNSHLRRALLLMVLVVGVVRGAAAEERLALVIGNSAYGTVTALENPVNDARLIATALERLGFDVTLISDASQIAMKRGIAQFGRELREAGKEATGLFYYAGHGVQSFGTNYLLPVDVALADPADLDLVAVEAQSVLRQMYSARNRTNIVILDACRNNPFSTLPAFDDNGLAEMQAPTGTFLAYATEPGGVALDGAGGNSPFTQALAEALEQPGQPIEQLFKQVRVAVLERTGGQQTPWDTSSMTSDFFFSAAAAPSDTLEELQVWRSVQAAGDPVQLMLFLRAYPDSVYAAEARRLLESVMEYELATGKDSAPSASRSGPSPDEQTQLAAAQQAGSAAQYRAFLDRFPDSVYAEFVAQEIAALDRGAATDPAGPPPEPPAREAEPPAEPGAEAGPVTFASPLLSDDPAVSGKSMAELIGMSPLFPPVEGLPESYWKDKTCASCHQWSKERLCDQAQVYASTTHRSLDKMHPFGGVMKRAMKSWAAGGCQ
ncbi:caspase family protein [Antarcticimicrobium luteum]|uniref:Caspase family protein n=1 Tax=Antarcticimicrobium luteum TaxID=2547397 RepID=A0A4R5VF06_9RHOB|nr:caspase family protein [Antarcticimicrobium luteum]TDK51049.1 caspase family protein [Antarcticimicrobium luteum]